jgi:Ca2+-binding EF-hand superfamily protein
VDRDHPLAERVRPRVNRRDARAFSVSVAQVAPHLQENTMNRKTLLFVAVLAALGAGSAFAATQAGDAQKPARTSLDKNSDGVIDKAEAAAHPRLVERFAELDKNGDGKLTADERPERKGMRGHGRHGGPRHGDGFKKLDTDGDGRISKAEAAADPRFAARFDTMDANKDGVIDRADRELRGKQRRDEWFAKADADKDGKLTRAEIDQADVARRAEFQQRAQARMDERFTALDTNKDGRLSRDEVKDKGRFAERFDALDTNKDDFLSKEELTAGKPARR